MVTRVSLSDWLAFQARIRGSKDPRLLRDRPTDGAAWVAKICARVRCVIGCGVMVMFGRFCGGGSARLRGYDVFMHGHVGQSFRLACPSGKNPGV